MKKIVWHKLSEEFAVKTIYSGQFDDGNRGERYGGQKGLKGGEEMDDNDGLDKP